MTVRLKSGTQGTNGRAERQRAKRGSGQLYRRRDGTYSARVTALVDGERVRTMVPLGTANLLAARRKLARLTAALAAGVAPEQARQAAAAGLTVADAVEQAHERWRAEGIKAAGERLAPLRRYALPVLGSKPVGDGRPGDVRDVLDRAREQGRGRQSLTHIKNGLGSVFGQLWRDETIVDNPVARVRVPKLHEEPKQRAVLTDVELGQFLGCPDLDPELKMLVLLSRTVGGMRTSDLHALDWRAFGPGFTTCQVPRHKTGRPQTLEVPEPVRPFFAVWHASQGSPAAGPVFPVRRGPRTGQAKSPENFYGKRLRAALLVAGVTRHELHHETDAARPVDFHSTRRAYCTALARANVATSVAQVLAGHSDPKVHQRYVNAETIRVLPVKPPCPLYRG